MCAHVRQRPLLSPSSLPQLGLMVRLKKLVPTLCSRPTLCGPLFRVLETNWPQSVGPDWVSTQKDRHSQPKSVWPMLALAKAGPRPGQTRFWPKWFAPPRSFDVCHVNRVMCARVHVQCHTIHNTFCAAKWRANHRQRAVPHLLAPHIGHVDAGAQCCNFSFSKHQLVSPFLNCRVREGLLELGPDHLDRLRRPLAVADLYRLVANSTLANPYNPTFGQSCLGQFHFGQFQLRPTSLAHRVKHRRPHSTRLPRLAQEGQRAIQTCILEGSSASNTRPREGDKRQNVGRERETKREKCWAQHLHRRPRPTWSPPVLTGPVMTNPA